MNVASRYVSIRRSMLRGLVNWLQATRDDLERCNLSHGTGNVEEPAVRHELSLLDSFLKQLRTAQGKLKP